MADTGPCGPCSEIFYDHGPGVAGGAPGSADADGDRYIEIWNLVFMQFNRDERGVLHPLPKPSVDTGMGLERIAAVLQGKRSNYDIDLFQDLIKAAARETHQKKLRNPSLNVIADHIRACSFLIVDGVIPDNEGRGSVLRRIIRRAIRHGYKLGQKQPFFYKLVEDLDEVMGDAYPELRKDKARVAEVLREEEERFDVTLSSGMQYFEDSLLEAQVKSYLHHLFKPTRIQTNVRLGGSEIDYIVHTPDRIHLVELRMHPTRENVRSGVLQLHNYLRQIDESVNPESKPIDALLLLVADEQARNSVVADAMKLAQMDPKVYFKTVSPKELEALEGVEISGAAAFRLQDTYGFPVDLTADIGRERGAKVDMEGFDAAMEQQRERARAASKFTSAAGLDYSGGKTEFRGYDTLNLPAKVVALYREGSPVRSLKAGESGIVVLDQTPFYAESGGQAGDQGELVGSAGTFLVADTQKIQPEVFGHHGTLRTGALKIGDKVEARVDTGLRGRTMRNHSVTHLMHKALREVLGPHVQQKGSLVDADKTRFDFSHDKPMTDQEIRQVELRVNNEIMQNSPTRAQIMPIEEAKKSGAVMLFGEIYGDEVRVLDIGSSREFCGGTHVARTGDIGVFKIYSEGGVAAGVRRVEATTGANALAMMNHQLQEFHEVARQLRAQPGAGMVEKAVNNLLEEKKALEKELARLRSKLASSQGEDLADQAFEVKGARVLAVTLEGADARTLRETMDRLKDRLKSAAIVLGAVADGKVSLVAGVTADLTSKLKAGELVNYVAQQVGGKGGGRPDMAQAGGSEPANLPAALRSVRGWVEQRL